MEQKKIEFLYGPFFKKKLLMCSSNDSQFLTGYEFNQELNNLLMKRKIISVIAYLHYAYCVKAHYTFRGKMVY